MWSVIMLNFNTLSAVMLNVIMLGVVRQNVVMLSVGAPSDVGNKLCSPMKQLYKCFVIMKGLLLVSRPCLLESTF
jgi:hypothetical protein